LQAGEGFAAWEIRTSQCPAAVNLMSWDDRRRQAQRVSATLRADALRGPAVQLVDHVSQYAWVSEADGQRRADNLLAAHMAQARHVVACGTVRSLMPGQVFQLAAHAQFSVASRFRLLSVAHQGRNNLSEDFCAALHRAFAQNAPEDVLDAGDYRHRAICLFAGAAAGRGTVIDTPYAPMPVDGRFHSKPTAQGVQTATVVGQSGQLINDDRNHRVKVQFHWQRGTRAHNATTHPTGDENAPGNDRVWAWVSVLTPAAGANWGGTLLPRIGQEVLIGFLDGDIDRPIVLGAAYNGQGNDDAQHNQRQTQAGASSANAPVWFGGEASEHAHLDTVSGIKTQALAQSQRGESDKQQGGYNQLVFDDHPQGGRAELGTTQAHSWLQLGWLRHQHDNARRESRGYGAQLETQGHGALRGGQGLLASAHARPGGSGDQLDSQEVQQTLVQQQQRLSTLIDRAQKHQAGLDKEAAPGKVPAEQSQQQLADSLAGATGDVAAWGLPDLVQAAPAGLGWLTPKGISLNAAQSLTAVGRDLQLGAQATLGVTALAGLRLFAGGSKPATNQPEQSRGLKLAAASGLAVLQAQKDMANVNALKNVMVSSNAAVTLASPTALKLACGGAGIELKGGNIMVYAPSGASFKAGMKKLTGAESTSHDSPCLPKSSGDPGDRYFILKSYTGKPVPNRRYRAYTGNTTINGVTDAEGKTSILSGYLNQLARFELVDHHFDEHFIIKDEHGNPMQHVRYQLVSADGVEVDGVTDEFGRTAHLKGDKEELVRLKVIPNMDMTDGEGHD
jgi:uncharacterized protein involved in type VI secretion and phage assembly/uncharacterized protein (DUF2345 family)